MTEPARLHIRVAATAVGTLGRGQRDFRDMGKAMLDAWDNGMARSLMA